jgi:biofilm PGA synthesis N-glycosyltransferase PgaC
MTIWFSFYLVSGLLVLSAGLSFVDGRRKRARSGPMCISVLVPCYNDARTMPNALAAIREAMGNRHTYEILVADDGSTDNSRELLTGLCEGGNIRLMVNPRNLGKSETLNQLVHQAAHDLILFMDADTLLHEKALEDMLSRLAEQPKLGAVSCPYQPLNKGILASLQALDYSMIRIVQASYNLTSGLALWGGCIAIRREAFLQAEGFARSAITEDVDLAHRLNQLGWKVQQSLIPVPSEVPHTLKGWCRQKMRWTSGVFQCLLRHPRVWMRNPLHVVLLIGYGILSLHGLYTLGDKMMLAGNVWEMFRLLDAWMPLEWAFSLVKWWYGPELMRNVYFTLCFMMLSGVYVLPLIRRKRELVKLLWIVPFSLAYFPMYALVSALGIMCFLFKQRELTAEARGW